MPTIDAVKDFDVPTNGSDATDAWVDVRAWARGQSGLVTIIVPPIVVDFASADPETGGAFRLFSGIERVLCLGYGARFTGAFWFGGEFTAQNNLHSARLATVSAGLYSVTCLTLAHASRFSVNTWAMMTGLDMQGGGYPGNWHYFEYVYITDITGAVITFSRPLKHTYKSTWPVINGGDAVSEGDCGGPATLFAIDETWNTEIEIRGPTLDLDDPDQAIPCVARKFTAKNIVVTGTKGLNPSMSMFHTVDGYSASAAFVEVDKLIGVLRMDNTTLKSIQFQSSSIDWFLSDGLTITENMHGTPKNSIIRNHNIASFKPGATAHGRTDSIDIRSGVVSAVVYSGGVQDSAAGDGVNIKYSIENGIITVPRADAATRLMESFWAVPGTNCMWYGPYDSMGVFHVVDITADVTNIYVETNLTIDDFPDLPLDSGKLYIRVHPCPNFMMRSVTGCAAAVDLSQAPANTPLGSYSRYQYTGNNTSYVPELWGTLESLSLDVSPAYTGATGTLTLEWKKRVVEPDGDDPFYDAIVNVKTSGNRVITPAGVTGTKAGDSGLALSDPAVWFSGGGLVAFSTDISGQSAATWPTITVEVTTDPGIVLPTPSVREFICDFS